MIFFKSITITTAVLAFCLVVFGSYVRISDAGLGCPDWPGCFGILTVPESQIAIDKAMANFPGRVIVTEKAWIEMIHRYVAGILGLLILVIGFYAFKYRKILEINMLLPYSLLGVVLFQATLGMLTVTLLLKPIIVTSHLIGGMLTLALLTAISAQHLNKNSTLIIKNYLFFYIIRFSLVLIFLQIFLGGWTSTNYAGLACTDYPKCHGMWFPDMDFQNAFSINRDLGKTPEGASISLSALQAIQWVHRLGAIIVTLYFIYLSYALMKYKQLKLEATLLIILIIYQFLLGIANILLHLPVILAALHNFGAAALVVILTIINSKIKK